MKIAKIFKYCPKNAHEYTYIMTQDSFACSPMHRNEEEKNNAGKMCNA